MQSYSTWFRTVLDLVSVDEEDALQLIRTFASTPGAVVVLPEGELSSLDALCYARTLLELGHDIAAEELVHEVIATEMGGQIVEAIAAA